MKITEIERVDQGGGINLTLINRDGEVSAGINGEANNFRMFQNEFGEHTLFYLVDQDRIIAAVSGIIRMVNGIQYYQIDHISVDPDYRGRKLAIGLYHSIMYGEGYHLMSDGSQTPGGQALWKNLSKGYNVKVMDLITGSIVSDNPADAYDDNINTVLVTEEKITGNRLLVPYLKIKENPQW